MKTMKNLLVVIVGFAGIAFASFVPVCVVMSTDLVLLKAKDLEHFRMAHPELMQKLFLMSVILVLLLQPVMLWHYYIRYLIPLLAKHKIARNKTILGKEPIFGIKVSKFELWTVKRALDRSRNECEALEKYHKEILELRAKSSC